MQEKRRRPYKRMVSFLCIMVMCMAMIIPVHAAGVQGSITVTFSVEKTLFSIYKVAEYGKNGKYHATKEFEDYDVNWNGLTGAQGRELAKTLEGYVLRDEIIPLKNRRIDSGKAVFDSLEKGYYLILGEQVKENHKIYKPMPILAGIPSVSKNGKNSYDLVLAPKYDVEDEEELDEKEDQKVIKIWKDADGTEVRPASVTVQLLRNGEVYDEVKLNESNNWQYTWKNLSKKYEWHVVEKEVPEGYTVTITKEGNTIIIENTYGDGGEEGTTEEEGSSGSDDGFTGSDEGSTGSEDTSTDDTGTGTGTDTSTGEVPGDTPGKEKDKLPQTGQLWWPVPILAIAGIGVFTIGWVRKVRK